MGELFEDLAESAAPGRPLGRARMRSPVRDTIEMRVCALDDLIGEDHRARLFWAYASSVELSALEGAIGSREGCSGRPALDPKLALALWLYALGDGVGSARELARACTSEAAYRWLCGEVGVNHHTLSDFRRDQGALIDRLLAEHVTALAAAGLICLDEIAQDGVRIRAHAGAASFRRRATLEEKARALVEGVVHDDGPGPNGSRAGGDEGSLSPGKAARRARAARERAEGVERALAALEEIEATRRKRETTNKAETQKQREPRVSTSDPDARVMKMPDGGFRPAFNAQFASDPHSGVIVAVGCGTVGSDRGLAEPMRAAFEETYGASPARWLIDGGFQSSHDIEAAAEAGCAIYCPPGKTKARLLKDGTLKPARDGCEPRPGDSLAVAQWRARMAGEDAKTIYRRRSRCELVHANLRNRGLDRLLVRGRERVETCLRWFALASNILTAHRLRAAALAGV